MRFKYCENFCDMNEIFSNFEDIAGKVKELLI